MHILYWLMPSSDWPVLIDRFNVPSKQYGDRRLPGSEASQATQRETRETWARGGDHMMRSTHGFQFALKAGASVLAMA
ncbi:MAG: hypothetical protein ACRED4_04475, partial [Brevundimonas sp.]